MTSSTQHERLGSQLGGRYRLEAIAGHGGMATVFKGSHERTGRQVAVKILDPAYAHDGDALGRFAREARVAAKVKHPNVVDVYDMGDGDDGGDAYIVLELLEGETFEELLRREGPLSYERAAELLTPVMRAMSHAHARGIIHRDLKPENVFLHRDANGKLVPKVMDFGIARDVGDTDPGARITRTNEVIGTPVYMSPEQARGHADAAGPEADVWSMGVVWYQALTGAVPFEGPTLVATLVAVNRAPYVPVEVRAPAVPARVAAVINDALRRDPARRYPDMGVFLDALTTALAHADAPTHEADPTLDVTLDMERVLLRERDMAELIDDSVAVPFELTRRPAHTLHSRSTLPVTWRRRLAA